MTPAGFSRLGALAAVLLLGCGGSRAPAHTNTVTLLPREQSVTPAATLTVALPQTHDRPVTHASRWTPPAPRPRDVAQARAHFAQGLRAYAAGDYARAVDEFDLAYAFAPVPAVLYNLGVALEKAGRDGEALDVYERYRQSGLTAARAADVQRKIQALRARLP